MPNKINHKNQNDKIITTLTAKEKSYDLLCYETIDSIIELEKCWNELQEICKNNFTFFQSFNWCLEYYKAFADDLSDKDCPIPQVFVLMHDQKPLMIFPMMRIQSKTGVKILTTGTEPLGQYCNLLFDPTKLDLELGQLTFKQIIKHSRSDIISLYNIPKDSMADKITAKHGIKEHSNLKSGILNLKQYNNWDSYHKSLSKSQRKDRKRGKNKLSYIGKLEYKVYEAGSKEYSALIKTALKMKCDWLTETGRKPGILSDERTLQMFTNLQPAKLGNNNLNLSAIAHVLTLDKKPIAIEMGMIERNHYYSYLGAMDWAYKDYEPGKTQIGIAQEWAMSEGIKYFDLLHDPSEYKSSWVNQTHYVISKNISRTTKGYLYNILWKTYIRPKLKPIYHFASSDTRRKLNKYIGLISNR